jgi:hypothetical protein
MTPTPYRKLRIGLNYPWPWDAYGTYFGSGSPPGSSRALDGWVGAFATNVAYAKKELGVELVRVFLFCNAWNLGTVTQRRYFLRYAWHYEPPVLLHAAFVEQLTAMLKAAADAGVQVIPSLLDFAAVADAPTLGGLHACGCRSAFLTDAAAQAWFFDAVLEGFLDAATPWASSVYAWEVMNEPYWLTCSPGARVVRFTDHRPGRALHAFLDAAIARIAARKVFQSTVGHRYHSDLDRLPTGTIRQFHYYPMKNRFWMRPFAENRLAPHARTNAILGEFATELVPPGSTMGAPWPDVELAAQHDTRARVLARLRHVEERGYSVALLWPDRPGDPPTEMGDSLKLSDEARDAVREYTR